MERRKSKRISSDERDVSFLRNLDHVSVEDDPTFGNKANGLRVANYMTVGQ